MAIDKKKEPIKTNIRQYVDNPSSKGSAYLASRKIIKDGLSNIFFKLLSKHRQQFFAIPYKYPNGDVLIHVKVPSEEYEINRIVYDVIFKIFYDSEKRYALRDIKVFSNSPSFLFTYAYVYYHSDLIPDEFVSKLPAEAITTPPSVRNPIESMGYEKSTYIAARYMLDGFVLYDSYIDRFGKMMNPIEEKRLMSYIADPQRLVEIYAHARDLNAKEHRKPVNNKRRQMREKLKQEYMKQSKASRPSRSGLFKKAPQAKIKARPAKRSLME
jgi:hypothetical protein